MTLGQKLQTLRTAAAMSQEDLGDRLGVSRQAVSKWELDKTVPDVKYIVELSELFQVSTDYLLKEAGSVPEKQSAEQPPTNPTKSSSAQTTSSPAPQVTAFSPDSIRPDAPSHAKAACVLLGCGNMLCLILLLVYLVNYLLFRRYEGLSPLGAILVLTPVLTAVCHGILWKGPLSPTVCRRYRRGILNGVELMGFAAIMPFGFIEVIDDLLMSQVHGFFSLPLLIGLTLIPLLVFWLLGVLIAHQLLILILD